MKHGYRLPVLAALGFAVTVAAVVLGNPWQPSAPATPIPQPRIPYAAYVAGTGVIEARHENIPVGTPVAGIVAAIQVRWGDHVQAGAPLFRIDDRALRAQLLPAAAKVQEAKAQLAQATQQLRLAESVPDQRAVSAEDMSRRRAGVAVATAALGAARAEVERIHAELELHTVRALAAGKVLRIDIRPGEYAATGTPLMLLGDESRLHVRADIDQNDAWRVQPGAPATAFLRGNPDIAIPLRFERIEPTIIPRAAVTGDSTERVDTRVLQIVYSFDPATLPVYVGQLVDVYIRAPADRSGGKGAPRP